MFKNFDFEDYNGYLEIIDNFESQESTTITRFNGTDIPNNLISVSNTVRTIVQGPCTDENRIKFNVIIKAGKESGKDTRTNQFITIKHQLC